MVFLSKMKTGTNWIKGIQSKLEYTQGIMVPSDGRSGGLALLWKEGIDVRSRVILTHISMSRFMIVQHQPHGVQLGFMGNLTQQKDLFRGSY